MDRYHQRLQREGYINDDQYKQIDLIESGKVVSVFYELRTILYLGVLLFTTGLGILIYQNIGDLGHLISIILLSLSTLISFWYVSQHQQAYSPEKVESPNAYFDYVLLLGALLFISVQGYLQFQYNIYDNILGLSTLVNAVVFFYLAYRHDHLGLLTLGITALASFWGLTISPTKWYANDFFSEANLDVTAMVFGVVLAGAGLFLRQRKIKTHFTFSYLNLASLIFFGGALSALFLRDDLWWLFVILIYIACLANFRYAMLERSYLFLLYAFVCGYIATTYLLAVTILDEAPTLWFYYSLLSCGALIYLVIKYKNLFSREG